MLVALVPALALAAGCEARLTLGSRCERASDCPAPLLCLLGHCREACVTSRDCAFGLRCIRDPTGDPATALRICSIESDQCTAGACPAGLVCLEGLCVNECSLGDECPDGVCRSGACEPPLPPGTDAGNDAPALDGGADAPVLDAPLPALDVGTDAPSADGGDDAPAPDAGSDAPTVLDAPAPEDAPLGSDVGSDAGSDAGTSDAGAARSDLEATLTFASPTMDDYAGWSVALSADGSRALVGRSVTSGVALGEVTVFARSGAIWAIEATLAPGSATPGDRFGISLSLSADGTIALVGAERADPAAGIDAGAAYVFTRTGTSWAETATLVPAAGAGGDLFGEAVALSGDGLRALVGAPQDSRPGRARAGSAVVFLRSGTAWTEEATLIASDGAVDDYFGTAAALDATGTRALVGVSNDDTAGGSDTGSVRVFVRSGVTWTAEAMLLPADAVNTDYVGVSIDVSDDGTVAIVGMSGDDTMAGIDAGSARIFRRSGTIWGAFDTLFAADGAPGDALGRSVALTADGRRAIVGAPTDDTVDGMDAGSVRVFADSGAVFVAARTLLDLPGSPGDRFGISVAIAADGSRGLVGAYFDDFPGAVDCGSARVFLRP